MGARPLLLLAVLLGGLLALKGLNLAGGAADLISERAYAQAVPGNEADETAETGDEAPQSAPDADPGADQESPAPDASNARRELPTASRVGLERNLAVRRRDLDRRAEALDTREQLITVAETRVNERIDRLRGLRDEVQGLLGQLDAQREAQISAIVATYAQLEPDAAAMIMVQMADSDPETLLLVAERLNSDDYRRRFAGIMAELPPQVAAGLTTQLRARAETADERVEAEARRAAGEG